MRANSLRCSNRRLSRASLKARGPGRAIGPRAFRLAFSVLLAVVLACCVPARLRADGFAGLGQESAGFATVTPGAALAFPRDFGAHPGFRTEWWYLTANLRDAAGASYGAQWTLFRSALAPGPEQEGWADPVVFMGHAAVTTASEHLFAETSARGGIGQAGVAATPISRLHRRLVAGGARRRGGRGDFAAPGRRLRRRVSLPADAKRRQAARSRGRQGIQPQVGGRAGFLLFQPALLHGRGRTHFARRADKGFRPRLDGPRMEQSAALARSKGLGLVLAASFLRRKADAVSLAERCRDATSSAEIGSTPTAATRQLAPEDVSIEPLATTKLAAATLPTKWRVAVKSHALNIETTPLNPASWMGTRFAYWEGPIRFTGSHGGEGYLEMTGY